MPARFMFPFASELWQPLTLFAGITTARRDARTVAVFGRVADGVSLEQGRTDLNTIAARLAQAYPATNRGLSSVTLTPLKDMYVGGLRNLLLTMLGAVAFVLLIACVNVANLLLARSVTRSREIAIRVSIGASRFRIVRQLLIESLVLAAAGGAIGLWLAVYGVKAFVALAQSALFPPWIEWTVDGRVLAFAMGLCLAVTAIFGLAPALHVAKTNAQDTLKAGGRGGGQRTRRWTQVFLAAELGLTVVLLAGAGLLVRSFLALYRAGLVVESSGVVTARVALPTQKYGTPDQRKTFVEQLNAGLASEAGVISATIASDRPFAPTSVPILLFRHLSIDGRPLQPQEVPPSVPYVYVGNRYFETLGLRLLRGRAFTDQDGLVGQEGAIVNQRFVARFFPDDDPIGHRIRLSNPNAPNTPAPWLSIVGVSPTVPQFGVNWEPDPVTQRTLEIGVRMALGARASEILTLFMRGTATPIALGLLLGLMGTLAVGRLLRSWLVETEATDPMTLLLVESLLTVVAMLASVIPASRATRVDPLVAIRCE